MIAEKAANMIFEFGRKAHGTAKQFNFYSNLRGNAKCTSDKAKSLTSH
jgi:hypothetical protein